MLSVVLVILIFATVALTAVVIVYVLRTQLDVSRSALQDVSEAMGLPVVRKFSAMTTSVEGLHEGVPFQCTYRPQNRSAPPVLETTLSAPQRYSFVMRRKNWFDRACSALGLVRSIPTGDMRFDAEFHIEAARPDAAAEAFADTGFRMRMAELFEDDKVAKVRFGPAGVSLTRKLAPRQAVKPEALRACLEGLRGVAASSGSTAGSFGLYEESGGLPGESLQMRLGAPLVLLIAAGLVFTILGTELYPSLFPSFLSVVSMALPYWLGGAGACLALTWLLVKNRTDRHVTLAIVAGLGIPAFFLASLGVLYFGNGYLDESAARERPARISRVYTKPKAGRKVRFAVLGRTSAELDCPRGGDYRSGEPAVLTVHDGRFGWEWVSGWRVAEE